VSGAPLCYALSAARLSIVFYTTRRVIGIERLSVCGVFNEISGYFHTFFIFGSDGKFYLNLTDLINLKITTTTILNFQDRYN
jgi:hypothetical protein